MERSYSEKMKTAVQTLPVTASCKAHAEAIAPYMYKLIEDNGRFLSGRETYSLLKRVLSFEIAPFFIEDVTRAIRETDLAKGVQAKQLSQLLEETHGPFDKTRRTSNTQRRTFPQEIIYYSMTEEEVREYIRENTEVRTETIIDLKF